MKRAERGSEESHDGLMDWEIKEIKALDEPDIQRGEGKSRPVNASEFVPAEARGSWRKTNDDESNTTPDRYDT